MGRLSNLIFAILFTACTNDTLEVKDFEKYMNMASSCHVEKMKNLTNYIERNFYIIISDLKYGPVSTVEEEDGARVLFDVKKDENVQTLNIDFKYWSKGKCSLNFQEPLAGKEMMDSMYIKVVDTKIGLNELKFLGFWGDQWIFNVSEIVKTKDGYKENFGLPCLMDIDKTEEITICPNLKPDERKSFIEGLRKWIGKVKKNKPASKT
jgi:hypothetical protein